ncbi:MAG: Fic family protein [Erysipelotrichaceae bacterium]|nr:Fic family protein [Erysipelotrichaceae bacterium]
MDELVNYVNTTDDHPLIIAAIVHYQLVTIHPFEDGNGRTARPMSGYILDYYGYGFNDIGSLEEYFAYDSNEYYNSLQMGLPPFIPFRKRKSTTSRNLDQLFLANGRDIFKKSM